VLHHTACLAKSNILEQITKHLQQQFVPKYVIFTY